MDLANFNFFLFLQLKLHQHDNTTTESLKSERTGRKIGNVTKLFFRQLIAKRAKSCYNFDCNVVRPIMQLLSFFPDTWNLLTCHTFHFLSSLSCHFMTFSSFHTFPANVNASCCKTFSSFWLEWSESCRAIVWTRRCPRRDNSCFQFVQCSADSLRTRRWVDAVWDAADDAWSWLTPRTVRVWRWSVGPSYLAQCNPVLCSEWEDVKKHKMKYVSLLIHTTSTWMNI